MKYYLAVTAAALLLANHAVMGQAPASRRTPSPRIETDPATGEPAEGMPKFDLEFRGGTPVDLVQAIRKASGKPLNAIIPDEDAHVQIPALMMSGVTVPELFQALEAASQRMITYTTGFSDFGPGQRRETLQSANTRYGFQTLGKPREDSIWYFHRDKPVLPSDVKTCRFWQLGPYLGAQTIDDITTAIQTGYKMLGEPGPDINFHKDTKLLIAVGETGKLSLIDSVLQQLSTANPVAKATPSPAHGEPKKP
jgi:hypothetical protein